MDAKFGCVPVAHHLVCHYALPRPRVASFGLRNRDIQDFSACVMSDADVKMSFTDPPPGCISVYLKGDILQIILHFVQFHDHY